MKDFTPTTEQVQGAYAAYVPTYVGPRKQAFARWKAQNDAEVRKQTLIDAARTLSFKTEGVDRAGTSPWPERHRQIYSLAIEEAVDALLTEAREVGGAS